MAEVQVIGEPQFITIDAQILCGHLCLERLSRCWGVLVIIDADINKSAIGHGKILEPGTKAKNNGRDVFDAVQSECSEGGALEE